MNTAIELLTRILCDAPRNEPIGGAYLYCATADNQASIFQTARRLITDVSVANVLILDAQAMSGYPGASQCRERLQKVGLPSGQIKGVPLEQTASLNTLIESTALIRYTKDRKIGSIIVVAPPFHQLRAFMTAVTVALKWYPQLSIYSCPGAPMPWMEAVAHSQGTLQAPRRQLIQEELTRINAYQEKGDLARFEAVLDYLNRRDMTA